MFAYCRNNPVSRIDISGTADVDYFDQDGNPCTEERDQWGKQSGGKTSSSGSSSNGPTITYLGGKMSPSSPGRLGGVLHRAMVDSLRGMFGAFGFDVSDKEKRVTVEGTKYRYPDLILRADDDIVAYVQVGKTTQSGDPVARERRAIADLEKTNIPVLFYAYDD